MKFYRNWQQICKVSDLNLRLALALIDDEALLAGLKRGFPKCFSAKPTETPLIPASALRSCAYRESVEKESSYINYHQFDQELDWHGIASDQFNIPAGPCWYNGEPVPSEIRTQLIGQTLNSGMKVLWQGEEYLVTHFNTADLGSNSRLGHVLTQSDLATEEMAVGLTPARFIDLNA